MTNDKRGFMTGELLLEIGTEEIPSGYLDEGLEAFRELAASCLKENRIKTGEALFTYGTPRRLVLVGRKVAHDQEDIIQKISGPPKKASYDDAGNPTKAALGFAKKHGVSVDKLKCLKGPKGEYLHVERKIPGRRTIEVLSESIPKLMADIPWPKSMRWGSVGFSFVRPIHWVLALFDGDAIPFQVAGVKSGNMTWGHRFMKADMIEIQSLQDYFEKMGRTAVIIDSEKRKEEVKKAVIKAARTVSGTASIDPELLTTVTNLVEYPSAVCGHFDRAFLNLPDPVLITPMRKHQRYFPIHDQSGRLMPNFVAVNNTTARDESIVRKGHERVLRARLSDADFFFNEDRKRPLKERLKDLKEVIYQAELGTSFDKVQRFTRLAEYLGERLMHEQMDDIREAAQLCKCDLVTEMVMEFPTLQGIIGKEYAQLDGHPDEVCMAIQEHYLPTRAGGELPASPVGAIVGLADRMDTITGCFAIGVEPTGTADPFALRRHALAIVRILEEMAWNISLNDFISTSLSILTEEIEFDREGVYHRVTDFFRERYKNMMLRSGYESDLIEAVISVGFDQVTQLRVRMEQLVRFVTESEDFESLVLTFKRVTNILKKQKESLTVDKNLFKDDCETELWKAYENVKDDVHGMLKGGNYFEALNLMMRLKRPVDAFFDGVEILTKENPQLRDNRLGILQKLAQLFLSVADFSKFSI